MRLRHIKSITDGPRQTNMELLRIVAMVLVLVVHADFVSLGPADKSPETMCGALVSVSRTFIEMAAMVCVNLFVLISGWFGIRASVKGFLNFAFQCLFFLVLTYVLWLIESGAHVTTEGVLSCLCMTKSNWFIKAYAALFILSPMLNSFTDKGGRRAVGLFVVLFFVYEIVWGWLGENNSVDRGYTAFSFIGLYVLARYMRLYYHREHRVEWLMLYVITVIINSVLYYVIPKGVEVLSYVNPFVIAGSLGLFMWFTKLEMRFNFCINFVAASAFAAYLFHAAPKGMYRYKEMVQEVYNQTNGPLSIFAVFGVIVLFFAVAVLLDQFRLLIWHYLILRVLKRAPKNGDIG